MRTLAELQAQLNTELPSHWKSCEAAGLPHTAASLAAVNAAFDLYFATLQTTGLAVPDGALAAAEQLYGSLDKINEVHGQGGLLETEERELLVPFIVDALVATGVDASAYDGEPGSDWRNF